MVRVGIIGCGGIAHGHVRRFMDIPESEVTALMDPDTKRLELMKRAIPEVKDVETFADHNKMLQQAELDAVVICSPHNVHYQQIVDSLRAGVHVLTEKPMVCTVEHARDVMAEERKSGKLLAISYQRHCDARYRFVRKMIQSGQAGEVQFISAFQGQNWMNLTTGTWRQKKELSCGGQLNDSGSHLIDIILWMTGLKADTIAADVEYFDREVDINSAVTLTFTNGAQGNISVVGNCPCPGMAEHIEIICSDWTFFIRDSGLTYSTGLPGETLTFEGATYGELSCDHNFINAILGRGEVAAPSICGLRTIELTEAVWRAAEAGETVSTAG